MAMFKEIETAKLAEHPQNHEYFTDIRESDPSFWEEFKDSIKQFGIIEPLIVNRDTMQVLSGNQRLKAAVELDLSTVPAILKEAADSDEEIRRMVASNVYRRTISPFAMFKYIGMLRRGASGKPPGTSNTEDRSSTRAVKRQVNKSGEFIAAADIFNSLKPEEREKIEEWAQEKVDRKEGEIIARLRQLEQEKLESDRKYQELMDEKASEEDRAAKLEEMLSDRDKQIEELEEQRNETSEENLAQLDAQIRSLEKEKQTLRRKVKELQEAPDVGVLLQQAIKDVSDLNSVLKEVLDNREHVNSAKFDKLMSLLERTYQIVGERAKDAAGQSITAMIEEGNRDAEAS